MKKTLEAHGSRIDGSFFANSREADFFDEMRESEGLPKMKRWLLVKSYPGDAIDEDDFILVAQDRIYGRESIFGVFETESPDDISGEEVVCM